MRHDQRAARAAFDLAGAEEETTRTWLDDWSLMLDGDTYVAPALAASSACEAEKHSVTLVASVCAPKCSV